MSGLKNTLTPAEQTRWQKLSEILSEREVSEWLGISQPTLSRHRRYGTGPAFVRLSARRVGYRLSAVEAWLQAHEREALDDPSSVRAQP
jgi:predicted DNA-binding transcriptional regulator AlpA